jgi:ABC-type transport system involved in cytochrome c biogenesis permease subunit
LSKEFSAFLLKSGIVAIAISMLVTFVLPSFIKDFIPSTAHALNFLLWISTAVIHYFLMKKANGRVQGFIPSFMLTTTLKLMVYFFLILAYAFTHRSEAAFFIVCFFCFYVVYTVIEITAILGFLNKQKS